MGFGASSSKIRLTVFKGNYPSCIHTYKRESGGQTTFISTHRISHKMETISDKIEQTLSSVQASVEEATTKASPSDSARAIAEEKTERVTEGELIKGATVQTLPSDNSQAIVEEKKSDVETFEGKPLSELFPQGLAGWQGCVLDLV